MHATLDVDAIKISFIIWWKILFVQNKQADQCKNSSIDSSFAREMTMIVLWRVDSRLNLQLRHDEIFIRSSYVILRIASKKKND